jgi:hypothetical protein
VLFLLFLFFLSFSFLYFYFQYFSFAVLFILAFLFSVPFFSLLFLLPFTILFYISVSFLPVLLFSRIPSFCHSSLISPVHQSVFLHSVRSRKSYRRRPMECTHAQSVRNLPTGSLFVVNHAGRVVDIFKFRILIPRQIRSRLQKYEEGFNQRLACSRRKNRRCGFLETGFFNLLRIIHTV